MNLGVIPYDFEMDHIDFYGDKIFIYETQGEPFIPIRPICEKMGLAWQSQYEKLSKDERWGSILATLPTPGGPQKMLCIPLTKFAAWLFGISPGKVKPELKDKLIRYQAECDKVLWEYWFKKRRERDLTNSHHLLMEELEWMRRTEDRIRERLREELSEKLGKMVSALDEHGVSLAQAVKLIRARKVGLSEEETARALHIDVEAAAAIEKCARRTGFWSFLYDGFEEKDGSTSA